MHELDSLPPILHASSLNWKVVGNGFDHPGLDTLVLAMPIFWKRNSSANAGRLHRAPADKADVRVIDFVDAGTVALMRMWDKRQAGYKEMGYRMADSLATMDLL